VIDDVISQYATKVVPLPMLLVSPTALEGMDALVSATLKLHV